MVQRHLLWRLYHLTTEITESARQVEEANEKLTGLRTSAVGFSLLPKAPTDAAEGEQQ